MVDTSPTLAARSADTTAEAEDVQVAVLRTFPVTRRLELAFSLTAAAISASQRALAGSKPGSSETERIVRFVELHYGVDLATDIRNELTVRDDALSPRG